MPTVRRPEAEEDDEDRRHQRAAAHTGEATIDPISRPASDEQPDPEHRVAAVFLKERATPMLGVGLLVAFAGVVLIATSTADHGSRDPLGVFCAWSRRPPTPSA